MTFAAPQLLWLLPLLPPALIVFFLWSWKKRQQLMTLFIQARLLPVLTSGLSPLRQKLRLGCLVLAVSALILALAQPQWGFSWQEVKQRGVDIVVAIDCSKSMLAQDIAPSRLARAKLAALELMQKARTDRLGVVAFAGSAFLQCPLTIDDAAFAQSVESLDVTTVSQGGTALAEALQTALTAFKEGDNHKVLVLMTDGEDHDSGALEAAQKAAEAGMRIYTIGIGTPEGELIRIKNPQGKEEFVRDEEGNVVKSRLNEELLRQIASATEGGFYLPLRGAKTIDTLYEKGLAELPKSEHQEKLVKQYHQRFHWPLGAALLLLAAEMLIPERRREHRPHVTTPTLAAKAATTAAVICLLALGFTNLGAFAATPGKALRDYKAGNYDEALKEYQQLLKRKGDDPRLHFNAGAAAYRNRQFGEATNQFDKALSSQDLKLQELSYYNRGNSLYYLGEQTPDPKKRTESWEKALKDFDAAIQLNPTDADAKFNKEFVKRKLEELKQQQQQQQDSKQDKSDQQDQNQNQQSQNSKQEQNQQQEQQQQPAQQNQSQQKQDSQQSQQNQQQQQQEQQQQRAAQQQSQMETNKQPQTAQQQQQPEADDQKKEQDAAAAGQMTREQAERLLDSQKGQEKMLSLKQQPKPLNRRLKDW